MNKMRKHLKKNGRYLASHAKGNKRVHLVATKLSVGDVEKIRSSAQDPFHYFGGQSDMAGGSAMGRATEQAASWSQKRLPGVDSTGMGRSRIGNTTQYNTVMSNKTVGAGGQADSLPRL